MKKGYIWFDREIQMWHIGYMLPGVPVDYFMTSQVTDNWDEALAWLIKDQQKAAA